MEADLLSRRRRRRSHQLPDGVEHDAEMLVVLVERALDVFQFAGEFAICTVPPIIQDLQKKVSLWSYFAQISDSTTSFDSYSGVVPNEMITWYKLDKDAPKYMIDSDASIVAPLVFAHVLGE